MHTTNRIGGGVRLLGGGASVEDFTAAEYKAGRARARLGGQLRTASRDHLAQLVRKERREGAAA